jgi:HNH endonuclease
MVEYLQNPRPLPRLRPSMALDRLSPLHGMVAARRLVRRGSISIGRWKAGERAIECCVGKIFERHHITPRADIWKHCLSGSVCREKRLTTRGLVADIADDFPLLGLRVPGYRAGRAGGLLNTLAFNTMAKRTTISKKLRFEVFKRDSFTCQYCGRKAPEILLEIDHIEPVSKGGIDDLLNLIASCKDCNAGKSAGRLTETVILDKRREQLEELQERKEQIQMMFQWQKELLNLDDQVIDQLSEFWSEQVRGFKLNENGIKGLKKLRRRFEVNEIMAAMKIAAEQYLRYEEEGKPTKDSVEQTWKKVGGICNMRRQEQQNPDVKRLYYIRGILRNRLHYINEVLALQLLRQATEAGAIYHCINNATYMLFIRSQITLYLFGILLDAAKR